MTDLRIVFMGTPLFAVETLKALVNAKANVVGVITAPDKPAGRGQKLQMSAVKQYALEHDLTILQPTNLKDPEFLSELQALDANLQIVVAFRMLPEVVWNMPELGTFNLHGSLLPQYRGAAPIHWAVMNGEKETGVTTFFLKHEIDTGHIIYNAKTAIGPNETTGAIHDRLMVIGAALVLKTVKAIENGLREGQPQEELLSGTERHAPKIFKPDCQIDWKETSLTIHNKIRGLNPFPVAWTILVDKEGSEAPLKIHKSVVETADDGIPGKIDTDNKTYLRIGTSDGALNILELQAAGKRRMPIQDFLGGFNFDNHTLI